MLLAEELALEVAATLELGALLLPALDAAAGVEDMTTLLTVFWLFLCVCVSQFSMEGLQGEKRGVNIINYV